MCRLEPYIKYGVLYTVDYVLMDSISRYSTFRNLITLCVVFGFSREADFRRRLRVGMVQVVTFYETFIGVRMTGSLSCSESVTASKYHER